MIEASVNVLMNANDIVCSLDANDDKVFMFIWEMLEHADVGSEVKRRLLEQLMEELPEVADGDLEAYLAKRREGL